MNLAPRFVGKLESQRRLLERLHLAGAGGFEICHEWSRCADILIAELFEDTLPSGPPPGFALLALGGYGRKELNPFSDIDLLFLFEKELPEKPDTGPTSIIPALWDIGFKVGHSTRTVSDCIKIAAEDSVSKTSMIEARFLLGDEELFRFFERNLKKYSITKNPVDYVHNKKLELELRHEENHNTLFLTEPNIKESPGGLRDYQTAIWVAAARYGVKEIDALEKRGLIGAEDRKEAANAVDFLLKIRSDLHFLAKGPANVLLYGLQPVVAKRLGYRGEEKKAVRAMMNDYYRAADTIYRFGRSIVGQARRYRNRAEMMFLKLRHRLLAPNVYSGEEEIFVKNLTAEDIAANPDRFFEILILKGEYGLKLSPALRKIFEKVGQIWKVDKPDRVKLNKGFKALLNTPDPSDQLRLMRDTKILTTIIPEFHSIRYLTPFDLYHKFTVDDHTFIAIKEFDNLKRNESQECRVLQSIYEEAPRKDLVRLAILLHDLGKGQAHEGIEDDVNPEIIRRLGFDDAETSTVRKLVQLHLLMNMIAQRRDIYARETIEFFCEKVGSAKILKKLYLLTYADTWAVGPGIWNSWKGALLKELYALAMGLFEKHPENARPVAKLSQRAENFIHNMPSRYLSFHKPEQIEKDAELFSEFQKSDKLAVASHRTISADEPGELMLISRNRIGLLSDILGTLASKNLNIHRAQIFTQDDGAVVDFFRFTGPGDKPIMDEEVWDRIEKEMMRVLEGKTTVEKLMESRQKMMVTPDNLPNIDPHVQILNDESFSRTIIEAECRDRLGLMYDMTRTLSFLVIDIASARVVVEGHRALASFYVSEKDGGKIIDSDRIAEIKAGLISAVERV